VFDILEHLTEIKIDMGAKLPRIKSQALMNFKIMNSILDTKNSLNNEK